jgi:hypothetical protein
MKTFNGVIPTFADDSGMRVVLNNPFRYIDMRHVTNVKGGTNPARIRGTKTKNVTELFLLIKNGGFLPERFETPYATENGDGTYTLICGFNRLAAHYKAWKKQILQEPLFPVTIIDITKKPKKHLVDTHGSVEYEKRTGQLFENEHETVKYVKERASEEDCINNIVSLINDNILKPDEDSIKAALRDCGVRQDTKGRRLLARIQANTGQNIVVVDNYEREEKDEFVDTYVSNVRDTGDNRYFMKSTFKGGSTPHNRTTNVGDGDYDHRLLGMYSELYHRFLDDNYVPGNPITVIASYKDCDYAKLQRIREYKQKHLVNDYIEHCRNVVAMADAGYYDDVQIQHMPQTKDELAEYQRTKQLITV